jgi:hypothetical protein
LVFICLGVGNTLEGCASHWYSFIPALATRSRAAPHIGIHSPRCWQHARELRLALVFIRPSVGNTLGGCAQDGNGPAWTWPWTRPLWPQGQFERPWVDPYKNGQWSRWPNGYYGSTHIFSFSRIKVMFLMNMLYASKSNTVQQLKYIYMRMLIETIITTYVYVS